MKSLLFTGFAWLVALSCLAQINPTKTMETKAALKKKNRPGLQAQG